MLDGLPLNRPSWGGASFYLMSAEDAERIEVVKGPFSSLYGGYAMAGVVNVITKMPEKREFTLKTGYGSSWHRGESMDDLKKIYFSFGDKYKDKISLFASYGRKDTNGYPASLNVQRTKPTAGITGWTETTDIYGATRYLIGDGGDRNYWNDQITLKTGVDFTKDSKLNLSFMRARDGKDFPEPHTYLKDATGNEVWTYGTVGESSFLEGSAEAEQNIYGIGFETDFSSVKTKIALGYLDVETAWWARGVTTATRAEGPGSLTDTPTESYNADIQFTVPLFDRHILTFGGSFRSGWADSKQYNLTNWKDEKSKSDLTYQMKGKDRTYALFVQDEVPNFPPIL
jgi:iron complex outermembrane receptor protein